MTPDAIHTWTQTLSLVLWTIGIVGIVLGLAIESLARLHGWTTVRRCVPGLVVVAILLMLAVAGERGYLRMTAWEPYCEDWFYYTQPACWFLN